MCTQADVVGRLVEVADAWAGLDPDRLDVGEVGRLLCALDRQVNRLQAASLALTASFARRGGGRAEGHRDTAGWLQATLRKRAVQARKQTRTARLLDDTLPETRKALEEGEISADHAVEIAQAADALAQAGADVAERPDLERQLVDAARGGDAGLVRQLGRRLVHQADADQAAEQARRAYARRSLRLWDDRAGSVVVEGRLHQLGGETLVTALNALSAPAGQHDDRSPDQRRADALVELARRAIRCQALPEDGGLPSGCGHVLGPAGDNATSIAGGGSVSTRCGRTAGATSTARTMEVGLAAARDQAVTYSLHDRAGAASGADNGFGVAGAAAGAAAA